jgi:hypothetical protein
VAVGAGWRAVDGVDVDVASGAGVFVLVGGTGVLVGGTGVSVGGTGVSVGGTGVSVGVGVRVGVFVGVGVAVGVFVGVEVGGGPIQIVTCTEVCWKLLPVRSSRIVCEPAFNVEELLVKDGPEPRKPFCEDVQKSCPRTSGVPSESEPQPEKAISVLSGMTAPSAGERMAPDGGPTAAAEAGDAGESIASEAMISAAAETSRDVRTATPIVNCQM